MLKKQPLLSPPRPHSRRTQNGSGKTTPYCCKVTSHAPPHGVTQASLPVQRDSQNKMCVEAQLESFTWLVLKLWDCAAGFGWSSHEAGGWWNIIKENVQVWLCCFHNQNQLQRQGYFPNQSIDNGPAVICCRLSKMQASRISGFHRPAAQLLHRWAMEICTVLDE